MPKNLQIGQSVYIPLMKVNKIERPVALYQTQIIERQNRSVKVNLPNGQVSSWISSSSVIDEEIGILIITIGDLASEDYLLNPLAKSILQFTRLLLNDDRIFSIKCRSLDELENIWTKYSEGYNYIILIGHGSPEGIGFCVDHTVDAGYLMTILNKENLIPKTFISLCCQTGLKSFAKDFSSANICRNFIAPFHSIHGAIASQFVQTFLTQKFLQGHSTKVAFKKSTAAVIGSSSFRLWVDGGMINGS